MNRAVLISGASRGIGACAAHHLADLGFTVYAGVRSRSDGDALCRGRQGGTAIRPVILDIADNASVDAAMSEIAAELGPGNGLHGLINNAGIYYGCPLQYQELEEIRQTVQVNLVGSMLLTRAALPLLRQARGRVVMHGSAMGLVTAPTIAVYGATKAAMAALSDGLRLELELVGVSVVLIEPGSVRTDMTGHGAARLAGFLSRMPEADRRVYEPVLRRVVELSDPTQSGLEAIEVAKVMALALTCRRPRSRYRVGLAAKFAGLAGLLPDPILDRLQKVMFGIRA